MNIRSLAIAAVAMIALLAAPAVAATDKRDDVWIGQVVRHNRHFDYRGSACPTSAEMCIKVLANYRIVPLNPQAARGLRRVDGKQAKLIGYLTKAPNTRHNGVLHVRRVERVDGEAWGRGPRSGGGPEARGGEAATSIRRRRLRR